jgi:hypothetical protein
VSTKPNTTTAAGNPFRKLIDISLRDAGTDVTIISLPVGMCWSAEIFYSAATSKGYPDKLLKLSFSAGGTQLIGSAS